MRRLSAFVGQVSQTMGNCLKSPTADDVSLLREGGNNSNSAEQLEQQPYSQVSFTEKFESIIEHLIWFCKKLCDFFISVMQKGFLENL